MADEAAESLAAARMIDARCDAFQQALAAGQSVAIESFLADVPPPQRQTLLEELLGLDADFRIARHERPESSDYAERFPELSVEQIAAIVDAAQVGGNATPDQNAAAPATEQPTILSPSDAVAVASGAAAATPPTLRYFGDYEVLSEIARGGMGVVFKARQQSLNRLVAIKMILGGRLASSEEVTRFRREAEAAAQLEHPSIVPIYEIGTHGDQHYFSMGYVDGLSLSARLLDKPLEPREAAMLIRDVALAVHYAHERGVVHRDLKPSNILLATRADSQPGELPYSPRVTDFGLAKLSRSDQSLTEAGQILGTPSYMPPEQAAGQVHNVGPSADIYSLGAVLYACLTGRPPFQAASAIDTVRQVLERDPVSLRDLNASIPKDLETIALKCLEKSIPRRYLSAKAIADELQRYLDGHPIAARPVSRRERFWRWCRRNPLVAGLISAVACTLLIGIVVSSYFAWKEGQRAVAEAKARHDEELQRRKADRQTEIAKKLGADNLKLAEDEKAARQKSDLNAEAAKQQTKLAKRHLYDAHMQQVQMAWDVARVGQANRLLDLYRPAPGQPPDVEDLRSFEWYYWDRCCHSDLLTLNNQGWVRSVAFSPDGRHVATGCIGVLPIKVWDLNTGQAVMSLRGHRTVLSHLPPAENAAVARDRESSRDTLPTIVSCVAYRRDGLALASGGDDGTIRIWDMTTAKELLTLDGHSFPVWSMAFSPDGTRVTSTALKHVAGITAWEFKLWDTATGQELRALQGDNGAITCVAYSADGKRLATTGSDGTASARVWDAESGETLLTLSGNRGLLSVAFSPDGDRLAGASGDGSIKVWHIPTGQELLNWKGHNESLSSVAFSSDGQRLVSASDDQTIKVWRADTGQEMFTLKGHTEMVNSAAFSPDGTLIASASRDGSVKIWDAAKGQEAYMLAEPSPNYSRTFIHEGHQLAVMGNRTVKLFDVATGLMKRKVDAVLLDAPNVPWVETMSLSADGLWLAVGCLDKTIRMVDMTTGLETLALTGHTSKVETLEFSPDGKRLVSGGQDRMIKVWDPRIGQETLSLKKHTSPIYDVAFSPNGKQFASASADDTVRVWDSGTGRLNLTLKGHTGIVKSVAYSADGQRLASASFDRTVKVWDAKTGREMLTLKGHSDFVTSVDFSPDGKRLVSGSKDAVVKLWDAITGIELLTFKDNLSGVFSPGGMQLVVSHATNSGPPTGMVLIRDATPRGAASIQALNELRSKNTVAATLPTKFQDEPSETDRSPHTPSQDWKGWSNDAPPPAIAPYDAERAKQSQEAWAKHLGVPVEYTNAIGMKFRLIPPGEFLMGSTPAEIEAANQLGNGRQEAWIRSEGPRHKVILTNPIYLGVHEVTQGQYEQVMEQKPSYFSPTGEGKEAVAGMDTTSHPVDRVSWNDAAEFCLKLSQKQNLDPYYIRAGEVVTVVHGVGYRLPSEAEWEFSSRAGTTTRYWMGDTDEVLSQAGWFNANTGSRTHAVGSLKANPFGLYDTNGNLWEWTQDAWDSNYYRQFQDKPAINPGAPALATSQRVLRGGSWAGFASSCRSSYRHSDVPTLRHRNCGFRVVLPVNAVKSKIARQKQTEGDKHRNQKEYAQAIACYREVITHEPNNLSILNRLAWLMSISTVEGQSAADTLDFAQRASQRDPNDLNCRNTLGAAQCRAGQFAEALRNLGEVDKEAPPNFRWRTHNLLFQSLCHQKLGDQPKAQAAYDKALKLLKPAEGDANHWFEEARLLQKEVESLLNPSDRVQKK